MQKHVLKRELKSLGVNIIKSNYVRKSDIQQVLSSRIAKDVVKSHFKRKVTAENKFDALEFDTFLDAYIEAALWAETAIGDPKEEEEGDRFDSSFQTMGYTGEDISKETMDQMKEDCTKFLNENFDLIKNDEDNGGNFEQAGHDFWLTRAGHGAGYWDGDWANGDELTAACKKFKNIDLYVGDDGLVYA